MIDKVARYVHYADDGIASRLRLRAYKTNVIVDPSFAFGQPVLAQSKIRISAIVDLFYGGESIESIAREYGIDPAEVEAVLRVLGARPVA